MNKNLDRDKISTQQNTQTIKTLINGWGQEHSMAMMAVPPYNIVFSFAHCVAHCSGSCDHMALQMESLLGPVVH